MKATINNTDYTNIANLIFANSSEENETIEVEYALNGFNLFLSIEHEVEYTESIGGSYEDYSHEAISEVAYNNFSIADFEFSTKDGDVFTCDFNNEILSNLLNN